METRPVIDEALNQPAPLGLTPPADDLTRRLIPGRNPDLGDRRRAWAEWQLAVGEPVLIRYLRAHNSTHETDEDILQETLLAAYLGLERGAYQPREGVPFTAYVVGIARNKIREARRRERHRADLDETAAETVTDSGPRLTGPVPRQPEQNIERREQRDQLRGGLSRLPDLRRQVLECFLSGASTGEIADRLSMSEALVRQHKCRGLRSLQREMAHAGEPGYYPGRVG